MKKTLVSFDWALKNVLRDKANFDITSGLLSELLGRKVAVKDVLESESNQAGPNDKSNRLDLKVKIDGGELAIFEVQSNRESDFFHRILYGTSKTVTEQMSKGGRYSKIKKVYSIDVVYFNLGKGADYIYRGTTAFKGLHNNKTLKLSAKETKFLNHPVPVEGADAGVLFPEYYLIYPNKFDENIKSKFDEWVYFFKTSEIDTKFTAAGIKRAGEVMDVARMTESERWDYEHSEKARMIADSEIESAKVEGWLEGEARGEARGEAKGRAEIAALIEQGATLDDIKKRLGIK